jgi:Na+/H+ antiporter NhaD/arsenite permease-like protein
MVHMIDMLTFVVLSGGMALAVLATTLYRTARQAAEKYRNTRAQLPELKKVRNRAWLRASFWILAALWYLAFVFREAASGG